MGAVTILGRVGCGACIFTKRAFDLAGIGYVALDVDESEDAARIAQEVAGELGRAELPIVLCDDGTRWAGLRLDRIADVVRMA